MKALFKAPLFYISIGVQEIFSRKLQNLNMKWVGITPEELVPDVIISQCTCPRYKSIMTIENGVWVNISTIFKIFTDLFDDKIYTTIPLSGMLSPGTSF